MFLWSQVPVEGTEAHLSIEQVYICFVDRWASAPSTDGLLFDRQEKRLEFSRSFFFATSST